MMRERNYIEVVGTEEGINFDGRFQVSGSEGIAYFLLGWKAEPQPTVCLGVDEDGNEFEYEDWSETDLCRVGDEVVAVMVGDDRRHTVDKSDLTEISEDDYCGCCGQIGCNWG
jgi:hypothetical protein